MKIDITQAVSNGKKVHFSHYRAGNAYYTTDDGDTFAVPLSDLGEATLLRDDKAIMFMRYMRKHNAEVDKASDKE